MALPTGKFKVPKDSAKEQRAIQDSAASKIQVILTVACSTSRSCYYTCMLYSTRAMETHEKPKAIAQRNRDHHVESQFVHTCICGELVYSTFGFMKPHFVQLGLTGPLQ